MEAAAQAQMGAQAQAQAEAKAATQMGAHVQAEAEAAAQTHAQAHAVAEAGAIEVVPLSLALDPDVVVEWACVDVAVALCFAYRHRGELAGGSASGVAQPGLPRLYWRCEVPFGLRGLLDGPASELGDELGDDGQRYAQQTLSRVEHLRRELMCLRELYLEALLVLGYDLACYCG
ncbi:hypothetical protein T492DRAFT_934547 [Pavlovales sp. CCMP2436]|nr:hypothetical protein T492DRAFT_934547 [Pavlovales sp. CCMP2436]